jgi:predicted cupin superfamily sugar epimerase
MHAEAAALIAELSLVRHPEGGYFRETWRSPLVVTRDATQPRRASTAIYFLLPAGDFSALHRVSSEEVWHHYAGDPIDLHTLDPLDGTHAIGRLGRDFASGERPQHVVPAGVWQAAVPRGERYALVGCTVSPGFEFADFELPSRAELLERFPRHEGLVLALTRVTP